VTTIKAKRCPDCGGPTKVVNSRDVHRWRECKDCHGRHLTEEVFKRKVRRYGSRKAA
jgi:transcriptional regulator NrdR family protein